MDFAVGCCQRSPSTAQYIPQKWDGRGEIRAPQTFQDRKQTCQYIPHKHVWNVWVFRLFVWRCGLLGRYAAQFGTRVATFRRNMPPSCSGLYWVGAQPGIVTKLQLDGPEFNSRSENLFLSPGPGRLWGPPNLHFSGYQRSFSRVKRPYRDVDHSHPSSAEIKNEGSYTSILLYAFMACTGTLTFTYQISRCHIIGDRISPSITSVSAVNIPRGR